MSKLLLSINAKLQKIESQNIILYSTGKTISLFGSSIFNFALGLYVLKLTGSALSFAITLILGVIPMVLIFPFAGVIADKIDKKKLVVSMDFLSGMLLILVYSTSRVYELNLILIYSTTFMLTLFTTFFGVAIEAAKPNMVSNRKLMDINSISKIIDSVSSILGPMIGGVVYAFMDIQTFILINGFTFIMSGLSILFIDFKLFYTQTNNHQPGKIQFIKDIKEGFRFLKNKKSILNIFIVLISINFFLGYAVTVPLPFIINSVLKLDAKALGIIQGALPVGMMVGAIFVKKITHRISFPVLIKTICSILSVLVILIGLPTLFQNVLIGYGGYIGYFGVLMFLIGISVSLIDIPMAYMMQIEIPDELRGRVLSIGISIAKAMLPIAMILSGVLLNLIPSYFLPISGGVLWFLVEARGRFSCFLMNIVRKKQFRLELKKAGKSK